MTEPTRAAVPAPRRGGTGRRRKRVLLGGPDARLVLAEHARQDRDLLAALSRRP